MAAAAQLSRFSNYALAHLVFETSAGEDDFRSREQIAETGDAERGASLRPNASTRGAMLRAPNHTRGMGKMKKAAVFRPPLCVFNLRTNLVRRFANVVPGGATVVEREAHAGQSFALET